MATDAPDRAAILYVVNVEVAVVWEGRYLLLMRAETESHAAGTLSPPGGKVEDAGDADDVLEETARREVREETGLVIGDRLRYVESHAFVIDDGDLVVDVVFLAVPEAIDTLSVDAAESAGHRWLTIEEIEREPLVPPWTRRTIRLTEQRRTALGW
jgi:8-oxo-dGTP pyrophosphatase MutT (NUDIX family)